MLGGLLRCSALFESVVDFAASRRDPSKVAVTVRLELSGEDLAALLWAHGAEVDRIEQVNVLCGVIADQILDGGLGGLRDVHCEIAGLEPGTPTARWLTWCRRLVGELFPHTQQPAGRAEGR
jgi:hypothetical protein